MKYTVETLSEINQRFLSTHYKLMPSDVNMANEYVKLIEKTRAKEIPKVGDVVRYTNEYGEYFHAANVDKIYDDKACLCENGNSYVSMTDNKKDIILSTSGGSFPYVLLDKFEYLGTTEKKFWRFGHCGACADGGIDFYATVNLWECNINKGKFSTKTHDKYYISYSKEVVGINYRFTATQYATSTNAWENEKDLQAWLRTFRAEIQEGNWDNQIIVWTYKEKQHHVSPTEYEKINGIEDVMCCNGQRKCKRVYDDENFTVHTYFVWYWEDPSMGDWRKQAIKQNELRKQWEVDYTVPTNIYAHEELRQGKAELLDIWKYLKKV